MNLKYHEKITKDLAEKIRNYWVADMANCTHSSEHNPFTIIIENNEIIFYVSKKYMKEYISKKDTPEAINDYAKWQNVIKNMMSLNMKPAHTMEHFIHRQLIKNGYINYSLTKELGESLENITV